MRSQQPQPPLTAAQWGLVEKEQGWVERHFSSAANTAEQEAWAMAGLLALIAAAGSWKPGRCSWRVFLRLCLSRRLKQLRDGKRRHEVNEVATVYGEEIEAVIAAPADCEPVHAANQGERARLLWAAVGTLPPRTQAMISLRFRNGWTLQQIGDACNISRARVAVVMSAAMRNINRKLRSLQQ